MAYEVTVAPSAQRDVDEIVTYLLLESPSGAAGFVKGLDRLVSRLASYPNLGPESRRPVRKGLRRLALPPYVVFYRARADRVEIVRVLHGARDLDDGSLLAD